MLGGAAINATRVVQSAQTQHKHNVYLEHLPSFKAELVIRGCFEIIFGDGLHGVLVQVGTRLVEVVDAGVWDQKYEKIYIHGAVVGYSTPSLSSRLGPVVSGLRPHIQVKETHLQNKDYTSDKHPVGRRSRVKQSTFTLRGFC